LIEGKIINNNVEHQAQRADGLPQALLAPEQPGEEDSTFGHATT